MSAGIERAAGATNARKQPKINTTAKIGVVDVGLDIARYARPTATAASPMSAAETMIRREKRSAILPVTNTKIAAGMNSTSPSHPRSNLLWVRSKTCFPNAVTPAAAAAEAQNIDTSSPNTALFH